MWTSFQTNFMWRNIFQDTWASLLFNINVSDNWQCKNQHSKEIGHLAGLVRVNPVQTETFQLTTAWSPQTKGGICAKRTSQLLIWTQHANFNERLNYRGIWKKWAIPVYRAGLPWPTSSGQGLRINYPGRLPDSLKENWQPGHRGKVKRVLPLLPES